MKTREFAAKDTAQKSSASKLMATCILNSKWRFRGEGNACLVLVNTEVGLYCVYSSVNSLKVFN